VSQVKTVPHTAWDYLPAGHGLQKHQPFHTHKSENNVNLVGTSNRLKQAGMSSNPARASQDHLLEYNLYEVGVY